MAGKSLAHRGTGGTSLTSEDDAVPDIDTNNVCEEAKFLLTTLTTRSCCRPLDCCLRDCRVSFSLRYIRRSPGGGADVF